MSVTIFLPQDLTDPPEPGRKSVRLKTKDAPALSKSKKAAPPTKIRLVWVVYNQSMKEFARFPYSEKSRAEAFAEFAQIHCPAGDKYIVQPVKEPME